MVRDRRTVTAALPVALLVAVVALLVACAPAVVVAPSLAPVAVPSARPATPSPSPTPTPAPTSTPTPAPTPVAVGALDGLPVDPAKAARLPVAVLIDDARRARPQSGFNAASVVYQAPADGGESRYMLVFQSKDARNIGPVRSGRMYFVQWASEMRSAIAHYGGDWQTRRYFDKYDGKRFTDVDALDGSGRAFHRIKSRSAPHNAYTNTKALWKQVKRLGGPSAIDATLPTRAFTDPLPQAERPARQTIRIPYRTADIGYRYDRASDLYRRSVDGKPQVDAADGKQVTTRNVVVLFMPYWIDTKIEPGHARPVVVPLGRGKAWIFREGSLIKGRWEKPKDASLMRLFDNDGNEIPLVRGRTFFQVVPNGTKVTHRAG
jgi:hypothetical protein